MSQHFLKFALVLSSFCFNTAIIAAEVGNPMPACLVSSLGETKTEDLQKYKGRFCMSIFGRHGVFLVHIPFHF